MYNTRNNTTQVTIMEDILRKQKHASHLKIGNKTSDLRLLAVPYGKVFMQIYAAEGNRRVLDGCGFCRLRSMF